MKKIFALISALTLLLVCCTATYGASSIEQVPDENMLSPVSGAVEMLKNPNFELDSTWGQYTGAQRRCSEYSISGYSLKLQVVQDGQTRVIQTGVALTPGAVYQISAWVYSPSKPGNFHFKVEHYGASYAEEEFGFATTAGVWQQVSSRFTVPAGITSTTVYLRLYGNTGDTVYVDNASLKMVQKPQYFKLETDQVYYYTNPDVASGIARISVNTDVYSNYSAWTADMSVLDGETVLYSKASQSLASGVLDVEFPLSYLSNPEKEYTVTATVKDSSGTVLEERELSVFRKFSRPSMIDKEGRFYVGGEEFMPNIGYHVYGHVAGDYEQAKSMGVNIIQTGYNYTANPEAVIADLDNLQKNGFMGLVCLYVGGYSGWSDTPCNNNTAISYRQATEALIPRIKDHPALFGYCLMDEPVAKKTPLEELSGAYEYIRSVDSVHPLYACDQLAMYAPELAKYNDIIGFDCYPYGMQIEETHISNTVQAADFYIKNTKKPVVTILQFFQRSNTYPWFPSANEMRNMLYQNYLAGGKGMGIYAFGGEVVTDYSTGSSVSNLVTPAADALRAWNTNEKAIVEDHFSFGEGEVVAESKGSNIWWRIWSTDSEFYLLALNRTAAAIEATIENNTFTENTQMKIVGGGDLATVKSVSDGSISLSLPASAAIVYSFDGMREIASESASSYSWRIYSQKGENYLEAENLIGFRTQTLTISDDCITEDTLLQFMDGDSDTSITELSAGMVEIKLPKSGKALYKLLDSSGVMPVPYYANGYEAVSAINAGETVLCSGYSSAYTLIALYDETGLVSCDISEMSGDASLTIPGSVSSSAYLKVYRWNGALVPLSSEWKVE